MAALERVTDFLEQTGTEYAYCDPKPVGGSDSVFRVVFSKPTRTGPVPAFVVNATFTVVGSTLKFTVERDALEHVHQSPGDAIDWDDQWLGIHLYRKQQLKDVVMVKDSKDATRLQTTPWQDRSPA